MLAEVREQAGHTPSPYIYTFLHGKGNSGFSNKDLGRIGSVHGKS